METLTTILFLAAGGYLTVLTMLRSKDIKLSSRQSGMLTPQLDAAIGNGDAGAIVTLCHNYDSSWLGRIVKSVVARADRISGSDGIRSEALRLLIDQAALAEIEKIQRGLGTLRTAAIVSTPIGLIASAIAANSAIFSAPAATSFVELSDALIYAAEGFVLSIIGFIGYKYLSAKVHAETEAVEELCDHLHAVLLLRRQEMSPTTALPQ